MARRNARSDPPPPKGCSVSDPCVFECVPPPYNPSPAAAQTAGPGGELDFFGCFFADQKINKNNIFLSTIFSTSGEPNVPKVWALPCLFHVFHFPKSLLFPLLFGGQKSTPDLKKAHFWPSISFRFLCLNNCKHRIGLGIRETLLRSAFYTCSFVFWNVMFIFASCFFSSPGHFFLILADTETLLNGPNPPKVMLSCW